MLRTDTRIVEPRRDRVRRQDLPVRVLEEVAQRAVQHSGLAGGEGGAVMARGDPFAGSLDPDETDTAVVEEAAEHPHRIGATADAGHHRGREPPLPREQLLARFAADDRLEVAHHPGIGIGSDHRADDVMGGRDVGDPVAERLVGGVLERAGAGGDRHHRGAEEAHPILFKWNTPARAVGLPFLPVTPTFPWLGPLGFLPLPTKWVIRIGEPLSLGHLDPESADDELMISRLTEDLRVQI